MQDLKILKKEYEKFRKKYGLPKFKDMNQDFEIEKLQGRESEFLLREIRRCMIEKNVSYFKVIEMFMNPSNAPLIFLALIKNMNHIERKLLEELYYKLGKNEILSLKLDNQSDEKEEAKFIKRFFKEWQGIKNKFGEILTCIEKSWEKKAEKKEKGYLG